MNISARRAIVDQTLVVSVQLRDVFLLQRGVPQIRVYVKDARDPSGPPVDSFDLSRVGR